MTSKKVIFMGTPEFAVPALESIISSNHKVVAIYTQEPRPFGRGMEIKLSPVHEVAIKYNIEVFTPKTLRNSSEIDCINNIDADVIVVCAFGFIIPAEILTSKRYGCINIHPSRLPRARGASPLQYTILEGDTESSVCIIQMDEGIDTGPVIMRQDFLLPSKPKLRWLREYTAKLGAEMVVDTLYKIPNVDFNEQNNIGATYAHKLKKENAYINFDHDAIYLDRKIRAYGEWPVCRIKSKIGDIKILDAEALLISHNNRPGTIIEKFAKEELVFACSLNGLKVNLLQIPSKKPMSGRDFLNGYSDLMLNLGAEFLGN
ncbi:MAG: methionyl-tRNA formyltransferase [Rickettsiaceae bacterium]|nr:methionyl-tRNA formyltransferase [Rickettsiaceae bacterium]